MAPGAACVYGFPYESTANENVVVPTPAVGTTGHRIVLRASWAARTVRVVLLSSTDGVSAIPALTQIAGTTWEISLATLTITTAGVIALADARAYAAINADVRNDSVDDTKAGARVPQFYRRQGGNATDWWSPGATTYTPGAVRMQAGQVQVVIPAGQQATEAVVTFPVAYSGIPLVFVTHWELTSSTGKWGTVAAIAVSPNGMTTINIHASRPEGQATTATHTMWVNWLAIGPE